MAKSEKPSDLAKQIGEIQKPNNSADQFGKIGQIRPPNWGARGCQFHTDVQGMCQFRAIVLLPHLLEFEWGSRLSAGIGFWASGLHLGRGFLWVFPGGCCIVFGALAIAGPVQPHTIHSAFTGSQRVWGKVKGQPSGSATNRGFVRVQRYNQLSYKPGLTVMCNKGFRCLMQYEKKVKNSDRSQSPAQTQIPKKAHPHPGASIGR